MLTQLVNCLFVLQHVIFWLCYILRWNLTLTFLLIRQKWKYNTELFHELYFWFSVLFSLHESWFLSPSLIIVCYEHHWRTLSWTCIIHLNLEVYDVISHTDINLINLPAGEVKILLAYLCGLHNSPSSIHWIK